MEAKRAPFFANHGLAFRPPFDLLVDGSKQNRLGVKQKSQYNSLSSWTLALGLDHFSSN